MNYAVCVASAFAGGSGLNVIVVVNQQDSNSVTLGNYYSELRQVPPENFVRLTNWSGGYVSWTPQEFTNHLLEPVRSAIIERGLTNQAAFVLLSMGIPYRVQDASLDNSTTSALFYGLKTNTSASAGLPETCSLPVSSSNGYAGTESPLINAILSWTNPLTTMVTASNLASAKQTLSLGAMNDATFPNQPAYLIKSPLDVARNVRYWLADNAVFDSSLQGMRLLVRTNRDGGLLPGVVMSGAQTGWMLYNPFVSTFVPGALVDNLTSVSGRIFENAGQLNILDLLAAGASGAYGTIVEPCNHLEKFPSPDIFFFQARGFTLAESYYQSLYSPYQGLTLGDPLSAPYAVAPTGYWTNVPSSPVSGNVNLTLKAEALPGANPVGRVDLYVDGQFLQTITNFVPQEGQQFSMTIDSSTVTYTVPAGATLGSVANEFAEAIDNQNGTRAVAYGDRISLSRTNGAIPGADVSISAEALPGSTPGSAVGRLSLARTNFLDTSASGLRAYELSHTGTANNKYLRFTFTKTNAETVIVGVTNTSGITFTNLVRALVSAVNTSPELSGADGVKIEDYTENQTKAEFNVLARSPGWSAATMTADLDASVTSYSPINNVALNENVEDLQPRNHLYVVAGLDEALLTFPLDTTQLSDGHHELTAVIMDGSNVRTTRRVSAPLVVQNSALNGTLDALVGGTNSALEATLRFRVSGSGALVEKVEVFGTGGLLGSSNEDAADFNVAGTFLGPGLHPVYGVVTSITGQQYRTATLWVRILEYEPAFQLAAENDPPSLTWPATAGRNYVVLRSTDLSSMFEPVGSITPTNSIGVWGITNLNDQPQFFKVGADY